MCDTKEPTYMMKIECENCGHIWIEQIPKGMRAFGTLKCPYCDCFGGKSQGKPKTEMDKKIGNEDY